MDFNSFELTRYYVNLKILYQGYYFLNLLVKLGTLARLMGVWQLSRVELMFWIQGMTPGNIRVCELKLKFLSYIKKNKKMFSI